MSEDIRRYALSAAIEVSAQSVGSTTSAEIISMASAFERYLLSVDNYPGGVEVLSHFCDGSAGSLGVSFTSDRFNELSICCRQGHCDSQNQSLAGGKVSCTHSSSSSVLADGDSGDSVAADPRNNGTPDTCEKRVNGDA